MHGRAVLFLMVGLLFLFCAASCRVADTPVASVNDVKISNEELQRFMNLMQLCNPEAVLLGEDYREDDLRSRSEEEFLHVLIGFELVNQAAAQAGVDVAPGEIKSKTEALLQNLVQTHYAGSLDQFHRQRKKLGLALDDLEIFPRYELQAKALFKRVASTVDVADLLLFIEENQEMLLQPAAAELYRFRFTDEQAARECLAALQRGAAVEKMAADRDLDFTCLGWVAGDDPFLESQVREELFSAPEAGSGCLIASPGHHYLYWIRAVRSARRLEFEEVKEEAALLKNCLLYEQFYYALWGEGKIEIYLR